MPPTDLGRFLAAQAPAVLAAVEAELRAGRKRTHWMWFIFPQLRALGRSETARFYGLEDVEEAREFWAHPVLRPRLAHHAGLVLAAPGADATAIMGSPDDLKLRSCATLFALAAPEEAVFPAILARFFGGAGDPLTLSGASR